FLLNESEPFLVAKPLNSSIGHDNILLSQKKFQRCKLEGATMINGLFLQKETVPQIKQDLIDSINDNPYIERRQANYFLFLKKDGQYAFKRAKTKCYANNVRDGSVWQGL
ncbi:MAG: hypothetical protein MUP70_08545, partial [Candidatus Aminicenantes bacterium]|nr:hypothetical protein [Candidatus Aminicenantes bacterium]